jgi:hypothetical protein
MLIARGDFSVFVTRPISAFFIALCVLLIATQIYIRLRAPRPDAAPERSATAITISARSYGVVQRSAAASSGCTLNPPGSGAPSRADRRA